MPIQVAAGLLVRLMVCVTGFSGTPRHLQRPDRGQRSDTLRPFCTGTGGRPANSRARRLYDTEPEHPEPRPQTARPLRILHISEVHWGGVVTLLRHFVEQQAVAGHQVYVLAPPAIGALPGAARVDWNVERRAPWSFPRSLLELRRVVRETQPDVIHVHSFVAGVLVRILPRRLLGRGAIVYQPHAWSFDLVARASFGRAVRYWERFASRRTDFLVANCGDEIAEGRQIGIFLGAKSLGVAVDLGTFLPVSHEDQLHWRRELGLPGGHLLVSVGRIARQKGQDLLVSAWESSRPPDTTLVLVGPGSTDALRSLAPQQFGVSILAVGECLDVRPWLWAADVLVLPSRYETVALVVAESMACGRPVVATAVNGVRHAISEGRSPAAGEVVELDDMAGLLRAAGRRLQHHELREAEGRAGRARAVVMFAPDKVAGRLEDAYHEAIAVAGERNRSR